MAALIARLLRSPTTDQGTFGRLQFGGRSLFTTELPWRNNRQQRSCIPAGVYQVALVNSPRFGRVYGVANVPGRSHVLIHAANLGGDIDMGWQTQLQGCIAQLCAWVPCKYPPLPPSHPACKRLGSSAARH